jgi:hypothetical protein
LVEQLCPPGGASTHIPLVEGTSTFTCPPSARGWAGSSQLSLLLWYSRELHVAQLGFSSALYVCGQKQLSRICLWSEAAQPYMSVVRSSSALYVCGQKQLSPICLWSEAPCPPRRERPKPYRKECPACTERPPPLSGLRVCPINWPVLSEKRRPLAARYIAYRLSTASSPPRSPSAQAASRWLYTHAAELSELVAEASRCGRRWRCSQRRQTHR